MSQAGEAAMIIAIHSDIILPAEADLVQSIDDVPTAPGLYSLDTSPCSIGRAPGNRIQVQHYRHDISRFHATIVCAGSRYILRDHSQNGTFVNGEQIKELQELAHGDVIGLGYTKEMLRFMDPQPGVRIARY
jgi:pSer/pThr/pTyr-binding forkhead associated (FHA) protein